MSVFIIAEIGINHNGSLQIAKKMIDIAVIAGCNAVKFQKRNPDICVPEDQKNIPRETPWGNMTYLEYRHKVEFGENEYDEIDQYCKNKHIYWFASAWDIESQLFLRKYNLKYNKVASAMLTNIPLLEKIAEGKKHTFVSTGMSDLDQVRKAVKVFREYNCPFELMHTVSTYPMDNEDANLLCIPALSKEFNCNVGYSGHERGLQITLAAVALGATSVERHITLDRTMYGSDQAASVEPSGLIHLVRDIRIIEKALGDGIKKVNEKEIPVRKKLRTN